MVAAGRVASRSRAADLIAMGRVCRDDKVLSKPSVRISAENAATLDVQDYAWVGRGGLKLEGLLKQQYDVQLSGYNYGLDLGASTGGFTQVLLSAGVRHVYAVDVGTDQLHSQLRDDKRITVMEGQDVRHLDSCLIPHAPDVVVADLSFISLVRALPAALALAGPEALLLVLVKPQFELDITAIGKGGIVRDKTQHLAAVDRVAQWLMRQGWVVKHQCPCLLSGHDGNQEYWIVAQRHSGYLR